MNENHSKNNDALNRFFLLAKQILRIFQEIGYGIYSRTLPLPLITGIAVTATFLILSGLDYQILAFFKKEWLYPKNIVLYRLYTFNFILSGFWIYGIMQVIYRNRLVNMLTIALVNCGLKNKMGKIPGFVSDGWEDSQTRKLVLTSAHFPLKTFRAKKEDLEASLKVYIDKFKEVREKGQIEFYYAHKPLDTLFEIKEYPRFFPHHFIVGNTRSEQLIESFTKIPHLLVAGKSGGGKSTFLRQLVTGLLVGSNDNQVIFFDLKEGLESQFFEKIPRMITSSTVEGCVEKLNLLQKELQKRMALLKKAKVKDIEAYLELKTKKEPLHRIFLVVDEVAEIFLAGPNTSSSHVQNAKRVLSQIARQGRAVGFHLIVATQKPDSRALDTQIKSNLSAAVCFHMENDASSISVLGNGRATDLPLVEGRAIWKKGMDMLEVQTPFLSVEQANELLRKKFKITDVHEEERTTEEGTSPTQETEPGQTSKTPNANWNKYSDQPSYTKGNESCEKNS